MRDAGKAERLLFLAFGVWLYDTAGGIYGDDTGDAELDRLLDDILEFIPLGNGLIQTDLQRRLRLRPAGGKHLQTDGFSIHENDLTFIIRALSVTNGEQLALPHTQGKGNMSGIVSADLEYAVFRFFGQQKKSRHR